MIKTFLLGCFAGADPEAVEDHDDTTLINTTTNTENWSLRRVQKGSMAHLHTLSPDDMSRALASSGMHAFTHAELRLATGNFSRRNFIGKGGFGPVFKGFLDDSIVPGLEPQHVAVKTLDVEGPLGHRQWLAEVVYLGMQLSHPHLVKLIGYCCQDQHRMLVYEFIARGSLEDHLFNNLLSPLPWATRLKIAVGAAKGLAFLHEADTPVIYKDFKASNILLESDYTAKLTDLRLAKEGPVWGECASAATVLHNNGYAAPEYILTGYVTVRSDVYSYGVVLLELLTGRRSVDKQRRGREQCLVDWARSYLRRPDRLHRVMDPSLEGSYSQNSAEIAAMVAYNCLHKTPGSRPTMLEVVDVLEPLLHMSGDVLAGNFIYIVPSADVADKVEGFREMDSGSGATARKKRTMYTESALPRGGRHRYASSAAVNDIEWLLAEENDGQTGVATPGFV